MLAYAGAYVANVSWGLPAIPEDLDAVLEDLGEAFRCVLGRSHEAQAQALGLPLEALEPGGLSGPDIYNESTVAFAELLATTDGLIALEIADQQGRFRTAPRSAPLPSESFVVTLSRVGPRAGAGRLEELAEFLAQRFGIQFVPFRYLSPNFGQLLSEGMSITAPPSEVEVRGAQLLADPVVRAVALAIATSGGGLLTADLAKQLPPEAQDRGDEIQRELESGGLISAELVVICSRRSSQVLRVPSREALDQMGSAGARCACGRPLLEERIENAVDLDELGRTLLNGSRWMSVLLVQTLHSLGVPYEAIVVEQKAGGDEMDCFADVSGELCLFELKDKEFSLGNAYSFGAKIGIYRPPHAIIITTATVGNDAKEHFERSLPAARGEHFVAETPSEISYIEGISSMATTLESKLEEIYAGDARRALGRCLPLAALSASSLIAALREGSVAVGPVSVAT